MSGVCRAHHIFGVEHLVCQLGHVQRSVDLAAAGGEGCEAGHEEVKAWEGHEVGRQLAKVGVELSGEPEGASHSRHGNRDQVVQVSESRLS